MNTKNFCDNTDQKEKIFIVFENRYDELTALIKDRNYTQKIMGEITWFLSLMETLKIGGYKVIHCENEASFIYTYSKYVNNSDVLLIMDGYTISKMIHYLTNSINKIYCMCYWGRDDEGLRKLGKTLNNKHVKIVNVLTPFDYNNNNSYLGYNIDVFCQHIDNKKYNNDGVIWGKDVEFIDLNIINYLCNKGLKFYSTSLTSLNINGVTNLGVLPQKKWHQLLSDCKFVLGSGHPRSGSTIIESLYYKTVLIGPKSQFPEDTHNSNICFIDNLKYEAIYEMIQNLKFEPNEIVDKLCDANYFNKRINKIFNLNVC